jgi:hypothetical protein
VTRTAAAGAVRILLEALCGPWIRENLLLSMILIGVSCRLCVCVCVCERGIGGEMRVCREGMGMCVCACVCAIKVEEIKRRERDIEAKSERNVIEEQKKIQNVTEQCIEQKEKQQ